MGESSRWHKQLIVLCAAMRSSLNFWRAHLSFSDTVVNLLGSGKVILWDSQFYCIHSPSEGRSVMCYGPWLVMRGRIILWYGLISFLPWWFVSLCEWSRTDRSFTSAEILHVMASHFSSSFSLWNNFHCATVKEGICYSSLTRTTILVWFCPSFPTLSHTWKHPLLGRYREFTASLEGFLFKTSCAEARRKIVTGSAFSKQSFFLFSLCSICSEWYYTVHICWNPDQNLLCMKLTYSVLGAQLGVQLESLPAHLWKKAWGLREILFSFDDFY